ncbi:uncharacterized protein QC763_702955 [Podospora pseudopauciseta]|uniref:Uncharacterized protein n=1 Tax=Podospora pseudopauciseta TaxID=2093780 RepID=A0ABR0GZZ9_9PEZI|nr:hypothetical protein QC763_702955 [Podospora pseudopauciseta]
MTLNLTRNFLLLASIATKIGASPQRHSGWASPEPTGTKTQDGLEHLRISHKPTDAPILATSRELRRGDDDAGVCGYFDNPAIPAYHCLPYETCTNIGNYRACCPKGDWCADLDSHHTACVDYTHAACLYPTPGTLCCDGEDGYGYCRQYHWSTSATPNRTFTVFACMPGKHTDVGTLLPTPPSGSSLPTESSNDPSYEGLLRFGGSTFSSTSDTPSSKSETPVGAIVGGAIGGLAVIGAVIVAILFMFFRSKKQVIEAKSGPGSSTSLSDHEQSVDLLPQQSPIARAWRPSSISYAPPLSGPGFTLPNPKATSTIVSPESEDDSLEQQQQHQPLMSMRGPMSPVNAVLVEIGKAKESPIELAETCGHYELASHPVK